MSKQYNAQIQIFSRMSVRGGVSWSTKQVKQALSDIGYTIFNKGSGTLIQAVNFSGTRDDIIRQRTEITDRLRSMSTGKMAIRFDLIKD